MKRLNYILFFAFAVLLISSCDKLSFDKDNGEDILKKTVYATSAGKQPVSGTPVKAYFENGVAALACPKAYSYFISGYSYINSKVNPDMFWVYNGGTFELGTGKHNFITSFAGKANDGRLIYTKPENGLITQSPWEKGYRLAKVMNINGQDVAVSIGKSALQVVKYDKNSKTFGNSYNYNSAISLPSGPIAFDIVLQDAETAVVYSLHNDGTASQESHNYVEQGYYDALGFWRGNIGGCNLYKFTFNPKDWSQKSEAVKLSESNLMDMPSGMCYFNDPVAGKSGVIVCGKFGSLKWVPLDNIEAMAEITDGYDNPVIYSGICHKMISIKEFDTDVQTTFVVSGEGAPYRFLFTGKYDSNGAPIFAEDIILSADNDLYCGSLCVPTVVDWDKDGATDIIVGNSEGRIIFYKNYGTDLSPAFGDPVFLQSCGEEIHFRGGYYEVQGPDDGAAWGYICPNVIDWNEDGILDIVTSSNNSKYEVMLGTGTGTADCLGARQTIYCDGMELWGMWRQRPALAKINGTIYMAFMDTEDALHLYKKISDTAVADCGHILLNDGKKIFAHYNPTADNTSLGYQGRTKLDLCDWDGDGDLDFIIGTPKQGCYPSPELGLPWNGKQNQLHVVYMENVGSNENIVLNYPKQMVYLDSGQKCSLGSHSQAPVGCVLGDTSQGINLLVGTEGGRMYFFNHKDIRFYEVF